MASRLRHPHSSGIAAARQIAPVRAGHDVGATSSASALRRIDWVSQNAAIIPSPPRKIAGYTDTVLVSVTTPR